MCFHIVLNFNVMIPHKQHSIYKGYGERQINDVPVPIQGGETFYIYLQDMFDAWLWNI